MKIAPLFPRAMLALLISALPVLRAQTPGSTATVYQQGENGYAGTAAVSISNEYGGNGITTYQGTESSPGWLPVWGVSEYSNCSLLRFSGVSVPAGFVVLSANLQVTIQNGSGDTNLAVTGYYVQSAWDATTAPNYQTTGIGWQNRATNAQWNTPGLVGGNDLVPAKSFAVAGASTYGVPLTLSIPLDPAVVQSWCSNPQGNQGVLLVNNTINLPYITVGAPWNVTAAFRPKLIIFSAPPNLGLTDAAFTANRQQFRLHWKSTPGLMQQVQVSPDLQNWTTLAPVLVSFSADSYWSDDGSLTGIPLVPPPLRQFYRLVLQPPAFSQPTGAPISFMAAGTGTSYLWNFGDGTTSTAASATHTFQSDGIFSVSLTVNGSSGSQSGTGTVGTETPCQILLTPAMLASVRAKVSADTQQWQVFKQRLDGNLSTVIGPGAYQGDELSWIADYALGYKALQFLDPATAANYADKAIGIMKSAMYDFQKGGEVAQQFLARGDGATTTFALPNSDIVASSLMVETAAASVIPVTRSASGTSDAVGYYLTFLKVSNTPDGAANYIQGTDWQHSGALANNVIDWSIAAPGHAPAAGATYYVTAASSLDSNDASGTFTFNGSAITFTTPPAANQAIYVQYVYGTHAADFSTLSFQQTSAGDGGFNSITIDSGYTSRYLGKFLALGYDWLQGYPGFSTALKNQAANLLMQWSAYWNGNGYYWNSPASNYGAGGYVSTVLTALALGGGRNANGPALASAAVAYRQNYLLPLLTNTANSYVGGFWAEGWNYGQQAARNVILAGLSLETAGLVTATAERQWAAQAITSLIAEQPTQATLYDGGDGYAFPLPFVGNDLLYMLAAATTDANSQAYANQMIQTYGQPQTQDMQDLIFRDPNAAAQPWTSALPLQNYAQGTGLIVARADWSYASTWIAFQLGNLATCDHQTYAQGLLQIQRGGDDLLVNVNAVTGNQDPHTKSSVSNLVAVDDNGAGTQNYSFNQGFWHGTPGCVITGYEATAGYVYAAGNYAPAYSLNTTPGTGTATTLTRQIAYVRPDYVFVHDRATTQAAADPKQLRWHFLNSPWSNAAPNSWVASSGSSTLFGQTFSRSALSTIRQPVAIDGTTVYRVTTSNTAPAAAVTYVTALQSAPNSTVTMAATAFVQSADTRMEGAQLGASLVLFGADAPLTAGFGTIAYTVPGSAAVTHLLTDLPPGQACNIYAGGVLIQNAVTSAQGTLTFTTAPGVVNVSVQSF